MEWISVKDSLPEQASVDKCTVSDDVLVTVEDEAGCVRITIGFWQKQKHELKWVDNISGDTIGENGYSERDGECVTAWMPLPEPLATIPVKVRMWV